MLFFYSFRACVSGRDLRICAWSVATIASTSKTIANTTAVETMPIEEWFDQTRAIDNLGCARVECVDQVTSFLLISFVNERVFQYNMYDIESL